MKGPLPPGWTLKGDELTDEEGYVRIVSDDNGRIDRERIATILRGFSHDYYARAWETSKLEAAAPIMLAALEQVIKDFEENGYVMILGTIEQIKEAIARAKE
jgi:hypothetical protein